MKRANLGLLLAVVVLLGILAPCVMAAETIDLSRPGELIIEYTYEKTPVTGATFCLYRVAEVDTTGFYTLSGSFADYPVSLLDRSDRAWSAAAQTLHAYARLDALSPDYVATIDQYGFAVLTDLQPGLYLLMGQRFINDQGMFTSVPALVPIPAKQNVDSDWYYSVSILPKCSFQPHEGMGVTSRKVIKVWEDKGSESYRPKDLTIHLLCNGAIYDTIVLNQKNNWTYVWTDLAAGEEWIAVEVVPDGYTVKIIPDGLITTITNTNNTPPPPPTEPDDTTSQTGMLWWPLPLLLGLGVAFIALGVKLRRYEA